VFRAQGSGMAPRGRQPDGPFAGAAELHLLRPLAPSRGVAASLPRLPRARRLPPGRPSAERTTGGVTELATGKVKDFEGLGFERVWNPAA